jgi:hypothetical protein
MGDINRTYGHIDNFLDSSGGKHVDVLAGAIGTCIEGAKRGYVDKDLEDDALVARIDAADAHLRRLATSSGDMDLATLKKEFREAATEAMACRRSILPLTPPGRPWVKLDPRKTLFDDEDQYSFAVYDTLADEVAKLLPALNQIAVECAWERDEDQAKQAEV